MNPLSIQQFLTEIEKVLQELNTLYAAFSDELYKQYSGDSFPEQEQLANHLDNLIISSTHEASSQVSFMVEDIKILILYIEFRKKYKQFCEVELEEIIDNENMNISFLKKLKQKTQNTTDIRSLKKEWNQTFSNQSFKKIIKQFEKESNEKRN